MKAQNDFNIPKIQHKNEQIYVIKDRFKKKQLHKKQLYKKFSFFIPDLMFQNICQQIACTDYDCRESQFIDAARSYRNVLMDYVRSKNGFGYAFFTQITEAEMRDSYEEYTPEDRDKFCNSQNLNKIFTAETPRFAFNHRTRTSATWMVLLLLLNVALVGLSIYTGNKYLKFN